MSQDQNRSRSTWTRLNALRHFVFGILLLILAGYVFTNHRLGTIDLGTGGSYAFGSLLVVYGIFRIWRGFADLRNSRELD